MRRGRYQAAVEFDEDSEALVRSALAPWVVTDGGDQRAALGVRVAKVGFRRRKVGLVYHGSSIRRRVESPELAADAIVGMLASLEDEAGPGEAIIPARVFVRGADAVVQMSWNAAVIDERELAAVRISEVDTLGATIEAASSTVRVGAARWRLSGIVLTDGVEGDEFAHLRAVWYAANGDRDALGEWLDEHRDRVLVAPPDELAATMDRLLDAPA